MTSQTWWFVARGSGMVAWGLSAAAVLWGMALSTRALGRNPRAPWLLDLHRFIGALTVVFVFVHLAGLFFDRYVGFGPSELFVPFAANWKPAAVAWGIVAFYLLIAIEVTSLLKKRIPKRLWHAVHLLSFALYLFATIHLLTAGTDATNIWLRGAAILSAGGVLFFFLYRILGPGRAASVQAASPARERVAAAPRSAGV